MRILIFHGYLLAGTGSNVYNARLGRALVGLGHEVHLLCQDRHPERQPFVDAVGDWDAGELRVRDAGELRVRDAGESRVRALRAPSRRAVREPSSRTAYESPRCTVYRPAIGRLLPVYVEDPYEGMEARAFGRCSEEEIERYLDANVAAVREVAERVRPDIALANHLVMGPVIVARALAGDTPYAVKVHGSALEYTVKPDPERFLPYAREGLRDAAAVLVGSLHTARSLWGALGDPAIQARTRLGPPGVDVDLFKPLPVALRPPAGKRSAGARLVGAPEGPRVAFVGKLIVNKGVDLLLAAWPLVLDRVPEARLEIVGFGEDREWLERLLDALARGDLTAARRGARRYLTAFLDGLSGDRIRGTPALDRFGGHSLRSHPRIGQHPRCGQRDRYLAAARTLPEHARFVGRLEHEELAELLPTCEALVVPSTFPEAFGMVAAEGAACGALPVSAAHSGLAEVSAVLARAVPREAAGWLSFALDDGAVPAIARCLIGWLGADPVLRGRTRAGLVETTRERWSWEGVARNVIAAARGELDALPVP